ncbi:uncharacterized protein DS421_1g18820 [Arachis hypogaea]|nr:uncharacterized protein DS421_1g18820 [Arachis hypogaea]
MKVFHLGPARSSDHSRSFLNARSPRDHQWSAAVGGGARGEELSDQEAVRTRCHHEAERRRGAKQGKQDEREVAWAVGVEEDSSSSSMDEIFLSCIIYITVAMNQ